MFSWFGLVLAGIVLVNVFLVLVLGAAAIWYHWINPRVERRRAIERLLTTLTSNSARTKTQESEALRLHRN